MNARGVATAMVAVLAIAVAASALYTAWAQSGAPGDGHAEGHDIYKHWSPPNNPKSSCCNAVKADGTGDCRPTRAYVDHEGNWRAWNGIAWLVVPAERVLPPNYAGDGRSHLCEKGDFIYCFTPGEIRG